MEQQPFTINRSKILINNILAKITESIEFPDNDTYLSWLRNEVGFTNSEIEELRNDDLFPEMFDAEIDY